MHCCSDILVSVYPCYAAKILDGTKTVELRRRRIRVRPGTRMWIYSTKPLGSVNILAIVEAVHELRPAELWQRFAEKADISKPDFQEYFAGAQTGCALVLGKVVPLLPEVALEVIRRKIKTFRPPQFFKKLSPNSAELAILTSAAGFRSADDRIAELADTLR